MNRKRSRKPFANRLSAICQPRQYLIDLYTKCQCTDTVECHCHTVYFARACHGYFVLIPKCDKHTHTYVQRIEISCADYFIFMKIELHSVFFSLFLWMIEFWCSRFELYKKKYQRGIQIKAKSSFMGKKAVLRMQM